MRGGVEANERLVGALQVRVGDGCEDVFAGAALAGQQYGHVV